jgi:hypothetical protein
MMKLLKHFILLSFLVCIFIDAMAQQRNKVYVRRNHVVLVLDMRSNKAVIDSLLQIAGITNLTGDMILRGNIPKSKNGLTIKRLKGFSIQIERTLPKSSVQVLNPYLITGNNVKRESVPGYPGDVLYGVNSFSKVTVRELPSGLTRFFLPGNSNARRVQLSGSFNLWTTIKGLMAKTDSGWISDIKLEPGPYAYKYIVNGQWTHDLTNNLKEEDGFQDYNSIYYRYNYTFRLAGNISARRVILAGSFNKWNANELVMNRVGNSWEKQLYLHEGVHLYRFMVDASWMTDPANKATAMQNNISSSVLTFGEGTTFKLNGYLNAKNVFISGNFNKWDPDMLRLQKTATGWVLPYTLPTGNYLYKFIIDGQWIPDPLNPHTITIDENVNSFLALRPNYTFVCKGYTSAKEVRLAGDFNNWNTQGYTMQHVGDEWRISMRLKPGKYLYKFLVDGEWIRDPGNRQWEQNEFGTGNSVLWLGN